VLLSTVPAPVNIKYEALKFHSTYFNYIKTSKLKIKGPAMTEVVVAGHSPRRPWFYIRPANVGFAVDNVALEEVYLPLLQFCLSV
jgi:hypothetical protein